jgi:putative transposase
VREVFERLFRKHGLPTAIQCDNGTPFICTASRGGLTQLSAWWVSLGIKVVRSRPGCPQDNGAHERMHRDLRADVQLSPEASRDVQQKACSKWRNEFNHVRPHEALGGKVPADFYRPGARRSVTATEYAYPAH